LDTNAENSQKASVIQVIQGTLLSHPAPEQAACLFSETAKAGTSYDAWT
jgi:hypothetical protein